MGFIGRLVPTGRACFESRRSAKVLREARCEGAAQVAQHTAHHTGRRIDAARDCAITAITVSLNNADSLGGFLNQIASRSAPRTIYGESQPVTATEFAWEIVGEFIGRP